MVGVQTKFNYAWVRHFSPAFLLSFTSMSNYQSLDSYSMPPTPTTAHPTDMHDHRAS